MKDYNLIESLVSEHKKVEPIESNYRRFFKWLAICTLCLIIGLSILGVRDDWQVLFKSPLLLIQNLLFFFSILFFGLLSVKLSIPGEKNIKNSSNSIYLFSFFWLLLLVLIGVTGTLTIKDITQLGIGCISEIIVFGLVPGASLFFFVNKGVILQRKVTGMISMLAAFSVGAYAVQYTCHNDRALHILFWHFIPISLLVWSGILIGKKLFRKL